VEQIKPNLGFIRSKSSAYIVLKIVKRYFRSFNSDFLSAILPVKYLTLKYSVNLFLTSLFQLAYAQQVLFLAAITHNEV